VEWRGRKLITRLLTMQTWRQEHSGCHIICRLEYVDRCRMRSKIIQSIKRSNKVVKPWSSHKDL
jgi:hypothetical protein